MKRCSTFLLFLLSIIFCNTHAMDLSDNEFEDELTTGGRVTFNIPSEALVYVTDLYNKFPKIPYQKIGSHNDDTYITSLDTAYVNSKNIIVSADNRGSIKIWNYPSDTPCVLTINAHDCNIVGVEIRPRDPWKLHDKTYLLSYSQDMCVKIWTTDGSCQAKFKLQANTLVGACWLSPDLIAIATDNAISVWNITSCEQVIKKEFSSTISCLAALDHGTLAYALLDDITPSEEKNDAYNIFVTDHSLHSIAQAKYSYEIFGKCTTILSCDTETIIIGCARGWLQMNYHNKGNVTAWGHEYKGICDPCTIQHYDNDCVAITRCCGLISTYNYKTRTIVDKRVLCKDSLFTGLSTLSTLPEQIVFSMYDQNLYVSNIHKIKQL